MSVRSISLAPALTSGVSRVMASHPPAGFRPVRCAHDVLASHRQQIVAIAELASVTETVFDRFYRPLLLAFAELLQDIPAPVAHAAAVATTPIPTPVPTPTPASRGVSGTPDVPDVPGVPAVTLLEQRLAAVATALRRRRAIFLPPRVAPEQVARFADRWTYAVVSAALWTGVPAQLGAWRIDYADATGLVRLWTPMAGALPALSAVAYRIEGSVEESVKKRAKERVDHPLTGLVVSVVREADHSALFLASSAMPAIGLCWLAGDGPTLEAWMQTLRGQPPAFLATILEESQ